MANELSLITVGGITYDIKDSLARETLNTILPSFFDANGHEYVEIAGIKWATMNIGARAVTDSGLYFQWGDTQGYTASQVGSKSGKKAFKWADYKYCDGTASVMTKYNSTDGKTVLEISDDAVADAWGGSWRMPTTEEFQALSEAVNAEWTTNYEGSGVKGLVLTDKTDSLKKLFFPAAGFADFGSVSNVNSGGKYWSSSLNSNNNSMAKFVSFSYMFNTLSVNWNSYNSRCQGTSVRGVLGTSDPQPLHKVAFSGDYNDLNNKPVEVSLCVSKTYSELKALRDNSQLKPGQWYRITDYVTTTAQSNTQSAGHAFDVIVRADSANILNENAFAALHSGDTYFANSKINSWELKYCLDNDTNRFVWADSTNGKGVIWWMKDEHDNECPYDFKNIMFKWESAISQSGIVANVFYYIFSVATGTNDATVTDHSLNGTKCFGNKMGVYINSNKQQLNSNVFRNLAANNNCNSNTFGNYCNSNTFGYNCSYNTFGYNCSFNMFGSECSGNTFGNGCFSSTFGSNCYNNTFGNSCFSNTFGGNCYSNTFGNGFRSNTLSYICNSNTFGNDCRYNTFGNQCNYNMFGNDCRYNTFGNGCNYNTFENNCQYNRFGNGCSYNTFWNDCYSNTFGNGCSYNTFGNDCYSNTFGNGNDGEKDYYEHIIIENGVSNIYLDRLTDDEKYVQNIRICQGMSNQIIIVDKLDNNFQTVYKHTQSREIIVGSGPLYLWFDDFVGDEGETKEERAEGWGYTDWEECAQAYVDDPDELGANKYSYTGQIIEYDGDTYYLWVMQDDGGVYSENVGYMITDTIDFDTLYNNSLEADANNNYCPYVALLNDDMSEEYRAREGSDDVLVKVVKE